MVVAVLLATYNRKEQTLLCLSSLYKQRLLGKHKLKVFLTDDASFDGTVEAIKMEFPDINVFSGSGKMYWGNAICNSWKEALKINPDYYLLINDDTILDDLALNRLLSYNNIVQNSTPCICVGSTRDKLTGNLLYGGQNLVNKKKQVLGVNVYSDTEYLKCDRANSNIILIPKVVVKKIGMLSEIYTHRIANFDYSTRAKNAGFDLMVVPGVLGYCNESHFKNWRPIAVSLKQSIKYLKSPRGLANKEYLQSIKLYFPIHQPVEFFKLFVKTLFPVRWGKLKS